MKPLAASVEECLELAIRYVNAGQAERARRLCEFALEHHPPRIGLHGARDQVEQRGFARANRPQNAHNLTLGQIQQDAVRDHERTMWLSKFIQ